MSVETVARAWPHLGLRPLSKMQGGERNVLVLMRDRRGGRWVLRGHARDRDPRRAEWQAGLQTFLAESGFPAAAHATTSNHTFVTVHRGMPWSLSSWLPGQPFTYDRLAEAEAAGRALALLHHTAARYRTPAVMMAHNRATSAWLADPQTEFGALAQRFAGQTDQLRWIERLVARLPSRLDSDLPRGLVHGDFHGNNLAFTGAQVVGVFDFDVIQPDILITDVARATVKFARASRGSLQLRLSFATAFIDGYQSVRLLRPDESRLAPVLWPLAHLRTSARYDLSDQLGDDSQTAFQTHIAAARAAEELALSLAERSRPTLGSGGPRPRATPNGIPAAEDQTSS